ncbi:unnamed protein product [Rotaria sp. Silwood2]|nr:unnamed protein product [Rotaria sp. Silwood2]CAF4552471.1 unnamed protein product [Rotaria sp. Silwood2]
MNTRRLNNFMANLEYHIDLNSQNNIDEIHTYICCEEYVSAWLDRDTSRSFCWCKLPIGEASFHDGLASEYFIWY